MLTSRCVFLSTIKQKPQRLGESVAPRKHANEVYKLSAFYTLQLNEAVCYYICTLALKDLSVKKK